MTTEHALACGGCDTSGEFRGWIPAVRTAFEHYRETQDVAVLEPHDREEAGVAHVCVDCDWSYHHGSDGQVDEHVADDHRRHGGNVAADRVDELPDPDEHRVALVDLANGVELYGPTSAPQDQDARLDDGRRYWVEDVRERFPRE